ncbi:MAG: FapA family protein, partial [Coriobacteriales bacterium]|nr:FapA family protein [Coriobacteriales bacterium]
MKSDHIGGVITFPGGIFDRLKIDGVCTTTGPLEANDLHIEGVFTGNGDVKADRFDCEGVVTINGNLRAKHADIDGVVTISGNKVEGDFIKCDGVLTIKGQVSADVIEAQGFINATEIVGDRIIIKSFRKSPIFKLWIKFKKAVGNPDFSKVDLIEATTVELRGVRAHSVNGENVIIGPACVIDEV